MPLFVACEVLIFRAMLKKVSYSDLDLSRHPMTREGLKAAQTLVGLVESNLWRGIMLGEIAMAFEETGSEVHFTLKEYVGFAKSALDRAILATNKVGEFGPDENLSPSARLPQPPGQLGRKQGKRVRRRAPQGLKSSAGVSH